MGQLHYWNGTAWEALDGTTTAPGSSPPAAPTNVAVTAGDGQVDLSWSAVTGADSYAIKRSTSDGGPYTTVTGADSLTSTSYSDSGLTNGTTYYYVVTATNADGESVASSQVSGTPTAPVTTDSLVTLTPSSGSVANGQNLVLTITVDSFSNNHDTVQTRLSYDPAKFSYVSVDDSNSGYGVEAPTESGTGWIQFVRGNTSPLTGQQEFVKATFQALTATGSGDITFDEVNTHVVYAGTALTKTAQGGSYTFTA